MQSIVAEFSLWKMYKVEIDLVAGKKGKSERDKICTDNNRAWEE